MIFYFGFVSAELDSEFVDAIIDRDVHIFGAFVRNEGRFSGGLYDDFDLGLSGFVVQNDLYGLDSIIESGQLGDFFLGMLAKCFGDVHVSCFHCYVHRQTPLKKMGDTLYIQCSHRPRSKQGNVRILFILGRFFCDLGKNGYSGPMELISLQSGSNGNCYFIRGHRTSIVVDAGISGKRAQERLAEFGYDLSDASGLVISHDHSDHAGCAGVFHRKFS